MLVVGWISSGEGRLILNEYLCNCPCKIKSLARRMVIKLVKLRRFCWNVSNR